MTSVNINKKNIRRARKIDFNLVVFLVCASIAIQYVIVLTHETGPLESDSGLISALLTPICCLIYLAIAYIFYGRIDSRQKALIAVGSAYLILRTLIARNGYTSMFDNIELIFALVIFGRLKLPYKSVRKICLFSVVLYLLLLATTRYDGEWFVNRIFTSVYLNRNHFCILTVINMYMALTALRRKVNKLQWTDLLIYAFGLCVIFPTTSRTSMVCVVLFIVFHIIGVKIKIKKSKHLYEMFIFGLIVSTLAILCLTYLLPYIVGADFKLFGRSILSGRNKIYSDAINTLTNDGNWIFGRGVWSEFTATSSIFGDVRSNTHNQWLQFVVNYGLVYLFFMIYVYAYGFKRIIGKRVSKQALMLTLFQILLFVYFTTEAIHYFRSYTCLYLVVYFTNFDFTYKYKKTSAVMGRRIRSSLV